MHFKITQRMIWTAIILFQPGIGVAKNVMSFSGLLGQAMRWLSLFLFAFQGNSLLNQTKALDAEQPSTEV